MLMLCPVHQDSLMYRIQSLSDKHGLSSHVPDRFVLPFNSVLLSVLPVVDEFQDTNQPQYELVKLLAVSSTGAGATAPDPHLFTVGDPDQAIYGGRANVVVFVFCAVCVRACVSAAAFGRHGMLVRELQLYCLWFPEALKPSRGACHVRGCCKVVGMTCCAHQLMHFEKHFSWPVV